MNDDLLWAEARDCAETTATDEVPPLELTSGFSADTYREALEQDDPEEHAFMERQMADTHWAWIAAGLNALLPSKDCVAAGDINGQYRRARERLGEDAAAWCRRSALLARDPVGWHDIKRDGKVHAGAMVRTLQRAARFVPHFGRATGADPGLEWELRRAEVFDDRTWSLIDGGVRRQLDAACAFASLPEAVVARHEPLRELRWRLDDIDVDAIYRVWDDLDENAQWIRESDALRDRRVQRWMNSWARRGQIERGEWITCFDEREQIGALVSRLAAAMDAWRPDNAECQYAVAALLRPGAVPPRRKSEWRGLREPYALDAAAVYGSVRELWQAYTRAAACLDFRVGAGPGGPLKRPSVAELQHIRKRLRR